MKKILLLTFVIFGLSCSSSEDNDPLNGNGDGNDQVVVDDNNNNSSCIKPNGLFVDNVTETSVRTNWDDANNSQLFNVEYGTRGFSIGSGIRVSSSTRFKDISGLSSGVEYDFYVRANCGGSEYSDWEGPHSFVTN